MSPMQILLKVGWKKSLRSMATGKDSVMEIRRSENDRDYTEGIQEMKKRGQGGVGGAQENSKWQGETKKWTEDERRSSGDPSEKVRLERLKQGQTDRKREAEKESGNRGGRGVFVSGRHFLSRGRAKREIMEGRMEGCWGWRDGEGLGELCWRGAGGNERR